MSEPSLKTSSYLILGLVRGGFSSGYAIRAAIQTMRMDMFWGTSFRQIYPELTRLERRGLLVSRDDSHGQRQRSSYALTAEGEAAFRAWMNTPDLPGVDTRDEGVMRLGFADHLSEEEGLELVRRLRTRAERAAREFREEVLPMAEATRQHGWHFPSLVARLGAEYNEWSAGFFARLEQELAEAAPPPTPPPAP